MSEILAKYGNNVVCEYEHYNNGEEDEIKTKTSIASSCREKQIEYEVLDSLQSVIYSNYILNVGAANANVLHQEFDHAFHQPQSKMKPTSIKIPFIIIQLFQELGRVHQEELLNDERFISVANIMNLKSEKLNFIIDHLIDRESTIEIEDINHMKDLHCLKSLNAFELFTLIIIFLNRFPSPIFQLTDHCSELLLTSFKQLPHDEEYFTAKKKKIMKSILDVSCEEKDKMSDIFDQIRQVFAVDGGSRRDNLIIKNELAYAIKASLTKTKQRMRRNLIQLIIANTRFELTRHMHNLFYKRRDITQSPKKKQHIMEAILAEAAENVACSCGPVILKLSKQYDSYENRIKAMASLLFYFDGKILYRIEKNVFSYTTAMSCHPDCLCGFGEPENINDPTFRNLFIGVTEMGNRRRKFSLKKSPVDVKKRIIYEH